MAEAESLKRQVVEARMAAIAGAGRAAFFLFNTLASIDHLIEVDPPRASRMQKNLIALLRASMPAMRESAATLGRELQVVRPYLEILKVRMEDRLQAEISVAEGLYFGRLSAMMLQSLVENAIKHGLEPKPEGGALRVDAEVAPRQAGGDRVRHRRGVRPRRHRGNGDRPQQHPRAPQAHLRPQAELRVAGNSPTGTRVSVVVPYKTA